MSKLGVVNQVVGVAGCRPHPRNYNQHEAGQIANLRVSLRRFGQVRSVVVQEVLGGGWLLVAGHGVVEAARLEGFEEVRADVIPADWDEATVLAYLAADNELARQGTADEEQMKTPYWIDPNENIEIIEATREAADAFGHGCGSDLVRLTSAHIEALRSGKMLAWHDSEYATFVVLGSAVQD